MTALQGIRTLVDSLDGQLTSQHDEIIAKLNELLTALGAPPSTPGITLADIDTRLAAIETLLTTDLTTISGQLNQIYLLLANFIAPGVENIFFAIQDLYSLQASMDNPRLPDVPSIIDLPTDSELLHCQRVQWMIDYFFDTWMQDVARMVTSVQGGAVALGLAVLTVGTGGAALLPAALFGVAATALVVAEAEGIGDISTLGSYARRSALRQALYLATNASAAQAAWNSTVDGFSDVNAAYRQVWKTLIWANWFNDLYNPTAYNSTTVPGKWDLDGYDPNLCATEVEEPLFTDWHSESLFVVEDTKERINWGSTLGSNLHPDIGAYGTFPIFRYGDFNGYSFSQPAGGGAGAFRVAYWPVTGSVTTFTVSLGVTIAITVPTIAIMLDDYLIGNQFDARLTRPV